MPCYVVRDKEATEDGPKARLVEASNSAAARNHVTRDRFTVEQARPVEIAELVKSGVEYEVATGAAAEEVREDPPATDTPPNDDPPEDAKKAAKARGEAPAE